LKQKVIMEFVIFRSVARNFQGSIPWHCVRARRILLLLRHQMKRFIKKRGDDVFYAGSGKWTRCTSRARDFRSFFEIQEEQSVRHLHGYYSVLLRFPEGKKYDIEINL